MKNLSKKNQGVFNKVFKWFLYSLPLALFFSYYPLIHFGSDETMNYEISLPLIWLVLFDLLVFFKMIKQKLLFRNFGGKWVYLLFPVFLTLSVLWSLNSIRGILTVGILWLIYFAVYGMYTFRELFDELFKKQFFKWFFGSTIIVCVFCFLQCILDLNGVSREYSLLCEGCTYASFGFPHPNGFAIEPQFMGNLLLVPAIIAVWLMVKLNNKKLRRESIEKQDHRKLELEHSLWGELNNKKLRRKSSRGVVFTTAKSDSALYCSTGSSSVAVVKTTTGSDSLCLNFLLFSFFLTTMTLFLTFSRGAIYAFIVAMIFLTAFLFVREKGKVAKRIFGVWMTIVIAFLFTLNAQGIMAAVSPTNDTYQSGIAKVLNHLSLGIVDIRQNEVVENPVENFKEEGEEIEAVFDGYVAESTETRLKLSDMAIKIWTKDFRTMMFGVGLGGAGRALQDSGLSSSSKEIIQNQYVSLLLETGLVGVILLIITVILIVRRVLNKVALMALIAAYGVSLLFFAGLANALQIYLLPMMIYLLV